MLKIIIICLPFLSSFLFCFYFNFQLDQPLPPKLWKLYCMKIIVLSCSFLFYNLNPITIERLFLNIYINFQNLFLLFFSLIRKLELHSFQFSIIKNSVRISLRECKSNLVFVFPVILPFFSFFLSFAIIDRLLTQVRLN